MDIEVSKSTFLDVVESRNRKSVIVAQATVTLGNGLTLECPIWMSLTRDRQTGNESITIEPGLPKNVRIDDDDRNDPGPHAAAFKGAILEYAMGWQLWAELESKAEYRLLHGAPRPKGQTAANSTGKLVRRVQRDGSSKLTTAAEQTDTDSQQIEQQQN